MKYTSKYTLAELAASCGKTIDEFSKAYPEIARRAKSEAKSKALTNQHYIRKQLGASLLPF